MQAVVRAHEQPRATQGSQAEGGRGQTDAGGQRVHLHALVLHALELTCHLKFMSFRGSFWKNASKNLKSAAKAQGYQFQHRKQYQYISTIALTCK